MPHQHQEILIKVPCGDRLPSELGAYVTDLHLLPYDPDEGRWMFDLKPSYWYEPATRVVLTVEEYKAMELERIAFKDFIEWMFKYKYSEVQNVDIPIETIRFIHNRLGYANP